MSNAKANGRSLGQEARLVMHEDGRSEDRLVLARFLGRMERQFALRAEAAGPPDIER